MLNEYFGTILPLGFMIIALPSWRTCFVYFDKENKRILIFATLLVLTLIGGYLFLSGDGSMTKSIFRRSSTRVNTLRNNTNQAIQQKADETKEKAMNKASQVTEEATNKMKEGIQKAVDESKKSIEKSVQEALNGTQTEAPSTDAGDAETENTATEE